MMCLRMCGVLGSEVNVCLVRSSVLLKVLSRVLICFMVGWCG